MQGKVKISFVWSIKFNLWITKIKYFLENNDAFSSLNKGKFNKMDNNGYNSVDIEGKILD